MSRKLAAAIAIALTGTVAFGVTAPTGATRKAYADGMAPASLYIGTCCGYTSQGMNGLKYVNGSLIFTGYSGISQLRYDWTSPAGTVYTYYFNPNVTGSPYDVAHTYVTTGGYWFLDLCTADDTVCGNPTSVYAN